jgi:GNAT superfamily N-acetyltransferase
MAVQNLRLVKISDAVDWVAYHQLRRRILFEDRGIIGAYDENRPEEYSAGKHSLLLKANGIGVGTTRLDDLSDGTAIVRLVAIAADRQRQGLGRKLGALVEDYARDLGVMELKVNAAPDAVEFYRKTGWLVSPWNPDELVGIAATAVQMRKKIV